MWQTASNAALGLLVSMCWLKLLLASAVAFNFSPLNHHLDLPMVVFFAGVQAVSTGRDLHKGVLLWPPPPTRTCWGSAEWTPPPPQCLAHHWEEDLAPSPAGLPCGSSLERIQVTKEEGALKLEHTWEAWDSSPLGKGQSMFYPERRRD